MPIGKAEIQDVLNAKEILCILRLCFLLNGRHDVIFKELKKLLPKFTYFTISTAMDVISDAKEIQNEVERMVLPLTVDWRDLVSFGST